MEGTTQGSGSQERKRRGRKRRRSDDDTVALLEGSQQLDLPLDQNGGADQNSNPNSDHVGNDDERHDEASLTSTDHITNMTSQEPAEISISAINFPMSKTVPRRKARVVCPVLDPRKPVVYRARRTVPPDPFQTLGKIMDTVEPKREDARLKRFLDDRKSSDNHLHGHHKNAKTTNRRGTNNNQENAGSDVGYASGLDSGSESRSQSEAGSDKGQKRGLRSEGADISADDQDMYNQRGQDATEIAEKDHEGLNDVALLELFSQRIKTGLPRDRFDWMHPKAPRRLQNAKIQYDIDEYKMILNQNEFVNYYQDSCCQECAGTETRLEDPDFDPFCDNCDNWRVQMDRREMFRHTRTKELKDKIDKLYQTKIDWIPALFQSRCHWCGLNIPQNSPSYSSRSSEQPHDHLFRHTRVDVEGVGVLQSVYPFDHEQKLLCLHCAAECGALLKEKRRFQSLYELSARTLPYGCSHCGIREPIQMLPAVDRTGEACFTCADYKRINGLDRELPPYNAIEYDAIVRAVVENMDEKSIHWDRVANNPYANPRFIFAAHGLFNRWLHNLQDRDENASVLSTYILLQHNHLTRRSQDWELYTCNARTPTQAALYFARFVDLYKKRPMTYLYIRKLESWNIPEPRGDGWEDLSSGLQTFDQLKDRIRRSVLASQQVRPRLKKQIHRASQPVNVISSIAPSSHDQAGEETPMTQRREGQVPLESELQAAKRRFEETLSSYHDAYPKVHRRTQSKMNKVDDEVAQKRWRRHLKKELGPANAALLKQLHWDEEERQRDFSETRGFDAPLNLEEERITKQWRLEKVDQKTEKISVRHKKLRERIPGLIEETAGLIRDVTGFVPVNPPEARTTLLPAWAQENAKDVVRKSVADNRLLHLHERHLLYQEYRKQEEKLTKSNHGLYVHRKQSEIEEAAKEILELSKRLGHAPRTIEDCRQLASEILLKGNTAFNRQSKELQLLSSGNYTELTSKGQFRTLPVQLRLLRPNSLRVLAGEWPELSDDRDPIQRLFLEQITYIDEQRKMQVRPVAAASRHVYYEDEFDGQPTFSERKDLPAADYAQPTPSGRYPIHLLPAEFQVHVFQSVLIPETRTANVRLVRTERYKRQGDCNQGGGPVAVPKVITRENMRGFYRESNRAKRLFNPLTVVVLKGNAEGKKKKKKGMNGGEVGSEEVTTTGTGDSGIEIWRGLTTKEKARLKQSKMASGDYADKDDSDKDDGGDEADREDIDRQQEYEEEDEQELLQDQGQDSFDQDHSLEEEWQTINGFPYRVSHVPPLMDETLPLTQTQYLWEEGVKATQQNRLTYHQDGDIRTVVHGIGISRAVSVLKARAGPGSNQKVGSSSEALADEVEAVSVAVNQLERARKQDEEEGGDGEQSEGSHSESDQADQNVRDGGDIHDGNSEHGSVSPRYHHREGEQGGVVSLDVSSTDQELDMSTEEDLSRVGKVAQMITREEDKYILLYNWAKEVNPKTVDDREAFGPSMDQHKAWRPYDYKDLVDVYASPVDEEEAMLLVPDDANPNREYWRLKEKRRQSAKKREQKERGEREEQSEGQVEEIRSGGEDGEHDKDPDVDEYEDWDIEQD
ncbi:hypothetical protein EDD11_004882 [Mortierella claussenii]|nr:hypothetical protein EDD11_004882 [Mortierella claussenii]